MIKRLILVALLFLTACTATVTIGGNPPFRYLTEKAPASQVKESTCGVFKPPEHKRLPPVPDIDVDAKTNEQHERIEVELLKYALDVRKFYVDTWATFQNAYTDYLHKCTVTK
jgi:hypothetical protein